MRFQAVADHVFDLGPETRVAFTLHVAGSEEAIGPGSLGTVDGVLAVIDEIVSQDFGLFGICGDDLTAAVDETVGLVEVDGLRDVVGDDGIVLPEFGDAINLNGEQDGDILAAQIAGQQDGGGCSPALSEQNDVSARFFLGGKCAVAILIEQMKDCGIGLLAAAILENANVGSVGKSLADATGDYNRAVMRIFVADKAADESDDNIFRRRRLI